MRDERRDPPAEAESAGPDFPVRVDGGERPLDELLDVLSNHRRRYVLYYLRETETADVEELTEYVVENFESGQESTAPGDRFEKTKATVIHTDLPKLRERGIVEYDPRSETVRYRQPSQCLTALLRVCSELENDSSSGN